MSVHLKIRLRYLHLRFNQTLLVKITVILANDVQLKRRCKYLSPILRLTLIKCINFHQKIILQTLGVPVNIFGSQGKIWIFELVRWPPWSNSQGKVDEARNIPTSSPLIEFCTNAVSISRILILLTMKRTRYFMVRYPALSTHST